MAFRTTPQNNVSPSFHLDLARRPLRSTRARVVKKEGVKHEPTKEITKRILLPEFNAESPSKIKSDENENENNDEEADEMLKPEYDTVSDGESGSSSLSVCDEIDADVNTMEPLQEGGEMENGGDVIVSTDKNIQTDDTYTDNDSCTDTMIIEEDDPVTEQAKAADEVDMTADFIRLPLLVWEGVKSDASKVVNNGLSNWVIDARLLMSRCLKMMCTNNMKEKSCGETCLDEGHQCQFHNNFLPMLSEYMRTKCAQTYRKDYASYKDLCYTFAVDDADNACNDNDENVCVHVTNVHSGISMAGYSDIAMEDKSIDANISLAICPLCYIDYNKETFVHTCV